MEIIAHRGASFHAPENSLAAFEQAIRQSADRIEFDVQLTADGIAVVHHDATTARAFDRDLTVARSSWDELRQVRDPQGNPLPRLDEALELMKGRIGIDLEIKSRGLATVEAVHRELSRLNVADEALVTCFAGESLKQLRAAGFRGPTGLLVGSKSTKPRQRAFEAWPLGELKESGCTHLVIHHKLCHSLLRRGLAAEGWRLGLWMAMEDEAVPRDRRASAYVKLTWHEPDLVIVARPREARMVMEADRVD